MKTMKRLGATIVFLSFVLAACGGGGVAVFPPPPVTGFTKTVTLPDAPSGISSGDWSGLFYSSAGSSRYQALVRAQDIRGSGPLRSLAFRFGAASAGNSCPNVTIKLVHRDVVAAALSTTFANNVTPGRGAVTTVFGPATLTIPTGALGDYFTIPLNGAFNYNGVDNLIVDIESDGCTANTVLDAHDASPVYTALIWNVTNRTAPTGSIWYSLADMKFTFAGGDNAVLNTTGTAINAGAPFTDNPGAARNVQFLYYAADINGSGPLTGIAFPLAIASIGETFTVTMKLGHSTRAELAGHLLGNNNYSDTPVTVANAVSLDVPAGLPVGSYFWVPMPDGSFTYNGVDNLIVEILVTVPSGPIAVRAHATGGPQTLSSGLIGTGTSDWAYDIKFRFAGGTMDAITPEAMAGGTVDGFPFRDTDSKRQFLYRAAELGSRGTISKIACRTHPEAGGAAETGFNYTLVLSHGTASTLGTNFAANLASPVTVFNGTFDLPAAVAGDWIEIPLTTPFAYNGRDNLVLEIGGSGGTAGGFACASDYSTTLYAGRRLSGATSTATTGSVGDLLIDTRFTLQ